MRKLAVLVALLLALAIPASASVIHSHDYLEGLRIGERIAHNNDCQNLRGFLEYAGGKAAAPRWFHAYREICWQQAERRAP